MSSSNTARLKTSGGMVRWNRPSAVATTSGAPSMRAARAFMRLCSVLRLMASAL